MNKVLVLFVVASVFSACEKEKEFQKFQDPYLDAFRNRGIKYMLAYSSNDSVSIDTTFFDREGNFIRRKGFMVKERRDYDSLRFITRSLLVTDIFSNYVIRYSFDGQGRLEQRWLEVNHAKWDVNNSDSSTLFNIVRFEVDDKGRIIKQTDSLGRNYSIYQYNEKNRLSEVNTFGIKSKELLSRAVYIYDEDNRVKKISFTLANGHELISHYYFHGLLDSTLEKGKTERYKYVYY